MDDLNSEKTLPPERATRFDAVQQLFEELPELENFIADRPDASEGYRKFLDRLRMSQTPEDAIMFTAFAIAPGTAVNWALDCILSLETELPLQDRTLIQHIKHWIEEPSCANRWQTLEISLFAPSASPIVQLGLAVGWSTGPFAPNDSITMPAWRTPRAIGAAILKAIGNLPPARRAAALENAVNHAARLFRVH